MKRPHKISIRVVLASFTVYGVGVLSTLVIGLFMVLCLAPFQRIISSRMIDKCLRLWSQSNLNALRLFCGLDYQVYGEHHLDHIKAQNKGFVVVSNHQSAFEIIVFLSLFNKITFVAKESLLRIPVFGWAMRLLKPVGINRKNRKQAMQSLLTQGAERIQENYSFISYPEGRRNPKGMIGEYKVGGLLLAAKTQSMILPIVHNSGEFWGRKSPWRFAGTMQMVIGKPIDVSQYDVRELTTLIEHWSRRQLSLIEQGRANPDLKIEHVKEKE